MAAEMGAILEFLVPYFILCAYIFYLVLTSPMLVLSTYDCMKFRFYVGQLLV